MKINKLDRDEILRYLGYKGAADDEVHAGIRTAEATHSEKLDEGSGLSDAILKLLDRCEAETLKILQPKYIYRRFPMTAEEEGIRVVGTDLMLRGRDIRKHLKYCDEIIIGGATAGVMPDKVIRKYMISEPDAGVIMDSCAVQAVEQIVNDLELELETSVLTKGQHLTWRFSPGYGDLPLETQRELVRVLDLSRQIGVTLTESCLMVPSKSVTAIWGICDTGRDVRENKCDFCNHRTQCVFRKRGNRC